MDIKPIKEKENEFSVLPYGGEKLKSVNLAGKRLIVSVR